MDEFPPVARIRPRNVWVAGILLIVFGALGTLLSLLLFSLVQDTESHGQSVGSLVYALAVLGILLAILEMVSGGFVIAGREWARKAAIAVCVLNAISGVITLVSTMGYQACVGIALNVALIVSLNKDDVKDWCR